MNTWLYIKQHNKTGLKYFGKTCRDPLTYNGSGKRWINHLKVHGRDITTLWYQEFSNKDELVRYATEFSKQNNIVESTQWANLIPENGLDGNVIGTKHSEETRRLISKNAINTHKGQIAWNKDKVLSVDHKEKQKTGIKVYHENNPNWYVSSFGNPEVKKSAEKKRLEAIQRKTIVDGTEYLSATLAAKTLGIKKTTLIKRVLSKNFPTYYYKE